MSSALEHEHRGDVALGVLEQIREELELLRQAVTHADAWGATDEIQRVRWGGAGQNAWDDYSFRGTYKSVAIVNENAFEIFVGFSPGRGQQGKHELAIPARGAVCLPLRSTVVSVGAATAGTATVIPFLVTLPFFFGDTGTPAGTQGGSASFVQPGTGAQWDVSDRIGRLLGVVVIGQADSLEASGQVAAPAINTTIAQIAAPGAGVYEISVTVFESGTVDANATNAQLLHGAVQVGGNLLTVASPVTYCFRRVTVAGGEAITVRSGGVAGGAGSLYNAALTAIRVA